MEECKFGVLNVYAPNISNERTSFWRLLANKIPSFDNWIVAGDFNMTERMEELIRTCYKGRSLEHGVS